MGQVRTKLFNTRFWTIVAIFSVMTTASSFSCKKDNEDSEEPLTVTDFMGTTGRRWQLQLATLTYYSADHSVDSTVTFTQDGNRAPLFFGDNQGVNGLYLNFSAETPLNRVLPEFGSWSYNASTKKLNFTCISNVFFSCIGNDGDWNVTSFTIVPVSGGPGSGAVTNFYFLTLERDFSLASGRNVHQKLELSIQ